MDSPHHEFTYFKPTAASDIVAAWERTAHLIRERKAPKNITLYVHWPYCVSQCTFCFCDMQVPRSAGAFSQYAAMLKREMDLFRAPLRGIQFSRVWFGGGTPTFMPDGELNDLLNHLRSCFSIAPKAEIYFEAAPSTLTTSKLAILIKHGLNHITMGVQTLDKELLTQLDRRGQTSVGVGRIYRMLQDHPRVITDFDLMVGLEGQTEDSFLKDFVRLLALRPGMVHIYPFDPRPGTLSFQSGTVAQDRLYDKLRILSRTVSAVARRFGYQTALMYQDIGDDLNRDVEPVVLELQNRSLQGFGESVLGLGYSAISHAFGSCQYQHQRVGQDPLNTDGVPPFLSMPMDRLDEMHGYIVRNLTRYGAFYPAAFHEFFGEDVLNIPSIRTQLLNLRASGQLEISDKRIWLPTRDLMERLVLVKHFYSSSLKRTLIRANRENYQRFLYNCAKAGDQISEEVADRILSRSLLMLCTRNDLVGGRSAWDDTATNGTVSSETINGGPVISLRDDIRNSP